MSQTREPSPSRENSPRSDDEDESLLALQIQAFLEASEDVDIDQETEEDMMQVLSEDRDDSGTADAEGISDDQTDPQNDQPCSKGRVTKSLLIGYNLRKDLLLKKPSGQSKK
jgi:NAD-dependent histone deacetylase SIR2